MGWTCKECENEFTNIDDKVIGCDSYTSYYCIECIEMTEREYKVLHRPDCFWCCPTCTIKNEENKHWQKEIVREIKTKFEGKIMELEKRMDEKLKKTHVTSHRSCQGKLMKPGSITLKHQTQHRMSKVLLKKWLPKKERRGRQRAKRSQLNHISSQGK